MTDELTEQEITEEISKNVLHLTQTVSPKEVMIDLIALTNYYNEHVYKKYQERLRESLERKEES